MSDSFADMAFDGKIEKDWVKAWDDTYAGLFGPAVAAAKAAYAAPPSPASPAGPASAYKGRYFNDFIGDAVVSGEGDGLVLKVGPGGARSYSLEHFDRDMFLTYPDAETPDSALGRKLCRRPRRQGVGDDDRVSRRQSSRHAGARG